MWGFFRQDEQENSNVSPQSDTSLQSKKGGSQKKVSSGKHRLGFGRNRAHQNNSKKAPEPDEPPDILNIALSDEAMNVAETNSGMGIEVSLDWQAAAAAMLKRSDASKTDAEAAGPVAPVVSPSHQLRQCRRVHRSQFSVAYPALERLSTDSSLKSERRNHRVPVLDVPPDFLHSYKEIVTLLERHETKDEATAVRDEVTRLKTELEAIEDDRTELDQTFLHMPAAPERRSEDEEMGPPNWDVSYLLGARKDLTAAEKAQLQQNRGLCLTFHMQNPRAREAFLSKCGSKAPSSAQVKQRIGAAVSLGPRNCQPGGAGAAVRHMAVMSGIDNSSSFFMSLDSGKSFAWGPLPVKLYRRMAQEGLTPQNGGGLLYLSTGPHGCYYCQFQSGECWWGSDIEDDHEFDSIVNNWDVYRVSFGPVVTIDDENGEKKTTNSWIILGYDGRVAWKNLPSRLHNRLYGRLADWAAPVEVALGSGDSYFVRFLDGTVDYCLPSAIASVCEHIEQNGGIITDMVLHPDASHDYVIRHTEITV